MASKYSFPWKSRRRKVQQPSLTEDVDSEPKTNVTPNKGKIRHSKTETKQQSMENPLCRHWSETLSNNCQCASSSSVSASGTGAKDHDQRDKQAHSSESLTSEPSSRDNVKQDGDEHGEQLSEEQAPQTNPLLTHTRAIAEKRDKEKDEKPTPQNAGDIPITPGFNLFIYTR